MRPDWKPPAPKWQVILEAAGFLLGVAALIWILK